MVKQNELSNAQTWELEVVCKNKEYLTQVVNSILNYGMLDFEVECCNDVFQDHGGDFNGHYTVLIFGSWFNNLNNLTNDLKNIEEKLDNLK
jgi:hypothetical protein